MTRLSNRSTIAVRAGTSMASPASRIAAGQGRETNGQHEELGHQGPGARPAETSHQEACHGKKPDGECQQQAQRKDGTPEGEHRRSGQELGPVPGARQEQRRGLKCDDDGDDNNALRPDRYSGTVSGRVLGHGQVQARRQVFRADFRQDARRNISPALAGNTCRLCPGDFRRNFRGDLLGSEGALTHWHTTGHSRLDVRTPPVNVMHRSRPRGILTSFTPCLHSVNMTRLIQMTEGAPMGPFLMEPLVNNFTKAFNAFPGME